MNPNILLTGAGGFFGVHLLKALLSLTKGKIYCLIRKNNHLTKNRFIKNIREYCHTSLHFKNVIVLEGDLSQPLLGLTKEIFFELSKEVNVIYHAGAFVHHLYSYEQLRDTNVLGTLELIKLATLNKLKAVNYISTLSAAVEQDLSGVIKEDLPTQNLAMGNSISGYAQTKWVSERLLAQVAPYIPINIIRSGWIIGDEETGQMPVTKNHLCLLIKGCIQMGCAPDWNTTLNLFPVNFMANFIAKLGLNSSCSEKVFNMVNPNSVQWNDLIAWINQQNYGCVDCVHPEVWLDQLKKIRSNNALFTLLPIYLSKKLTPPDITSLIHHTHTDSMLEFFRLCYPAITNQLLLRQFKYFEKIGFIQEIDPIAA